MGQHFAETSSLRTPVDEIMTKNLVYAIPCCKKYKGKNRPPLKVKMQEHFEAVRRGEIEKSGVERRPQQGHISHWIKRSFDPVTKPKELFCENNVNNTEKMLLGISAMR